MQAYQRMKDSGAAWLDGVPVTWDVLRVKQVFTRKNSKANLPKPVVLSLSRSGVKVRDISNNEGQLAESYSNYNPVEPGDVLLNPMDLNSGANCSLSRVSGVISPAYVNLRPKDGHDPRFFNYYFKLQYLSMRFFAWGKGVSYENRWTLSTEVLMNYPVIVPPSAEQCKIANYLNKETEKTDSLIAKQEYLLDLLEEKRRTLITRAVTVGVNAISDTEAPNPITPPHWEAVKIKTFCRIYNGKEGYKEMGVCANGYPVVGSGGEFARSSEFLFDGKSVLFGRKGTVDRPLYFEGKLWAVDTVFWTDIDKRKVVPKFFYYAALSVPYDYYKTQTALPSMTQHDILNHRILLPPKLEQEQIVEHLDSQEDKFRKARKRIQTQIELLKEYSDSLISEAVFGKATV